MRSWMRALVVFSAFTACLLSRGHECACCKVSLKLSTPSRCMCRALFQHRRAELHLPVCGTCVAPRRLHWHCHAPIAGCHRGATTSLRALAVRSFRTTCSTLAPGEPSSHLDHRRHHSARQRGEHTEKLEHVRVLRYSWHREELAQIVGKRQAAAFNKTRIQVVAEHFGLLGR